MDLQGNIVGDTLLEYLYEFSEVRDPFFHGASRYLKVVMFPFVQVRSLTGFSDGLQSEIIMRGGLVVTSNALIRGELRVQAPNPPPRCLVLRASKRLI